MTAEQNRNLSALLNDSSEEEFKRTLHKITNLVKTIAASDMDLNQLEAFLTSQVKKKDSDMTEDEANVFFKFWKNHKSRVHDSLVNRTSWNDSLKSVDWRVDIVNKSRYLSSVGEPVTVVEMQVEKKNIKDTRVIRFEVNGKQLDNLISTLNDVKNVITNST
ncbi:COMMD1 (predicted) [Pycnogonum litorale]